MKKAARVAGFVEELNAKCPRGMDPHLAGYFECFNSGRYYEAHDVLEDLWLRQGKDHPDCAFHKGLIQLAGAFVHLRLQHLHPDHPKHGRRLAPALRLFTLAIKNLRPYAPLHLGTDVFGAIGLAESHSKRLQDAGANPWSPAHHPFLTPPTAD